MRRHRRRTGRRHGGRSRRLDSGRRTRRCCYSRCLTKAFAKPPSAALAACEGTPWQWLRGPQRPRQPDGESCRSAAGEDDGQRTVGARTAERVQEVTAAASSAGARTRSGGARTSCRSTNTTINRRAETRRAASRRDGRERLSKSPWADAAAADASGSDGNAPAYDGDGNAPACSGTLNGCFGVNAPECGGAPGACFGDNAPTYGGVSAATAARQRPVAPQRERCWQQCGGGHAVVGKRDDCRGDAGGAGGNPCGSARRQYRQTKWWTRADRETTRRRTRPPGAGGDGDDSEGSTVRNHFCRRTLHGLLST